MKRKLAMVNNEKVKALPSSKLKDLKNENDRLKKELSSFSLDFFEEIEDLKFKYSEAVTRLAHYGEVSDDTVIQAKLFP